MKTNKQLIKEFEENYSEYSYWKGSKTQLEVLLDIRSLLFKIREGL